MRMTSAVPQVDLESVRQAHANSSKLSQEVTIVKTRYEQLQKQVKQLQDTMTQQYDEGITWL